MKQELFKQIAHNAAWSKVVNEEFKGRCMTNLYKCEKLLPSGSGIDLGCTITVEKSDKNRIEILTAFHHMDEFGGYDGWTEHKVILTPNFQHGFDMRITGRNRNGIKEYLMDIFDTCLLERIEL